MITSSTAAGKAIPPHFQFSTTLKIWYQQFKGVASDNRNERKGGMVDVEFREYFLNSIIPLFPDSNNVNGKRVMVKVDSGPGRLQEDFLAEARTLGLIVYPGVPNTTAVKQETDQNYVPFKTHFLKILRDLPPYLVGLIVFDDVDSVSKVVVSDSALELGFSKEQNCEAWKKVGATPLTRACLKNQNQVRRKMGDAKDAANNTMQHIQTTNYLSTYFLKEHCFNSDALKASLKKVKKQSVTVRNSQEWIDAISKATTHGNLFHATGGGHLTDEDVFFALQKKKVKAEIKQLKKKKDVSLKMGDVAAKANAIIQQQKLYTTYTKGELSVLLVYRQVKGISGMKKDVMVSKWKQILESKKAAPACDCWSDENERRLMHPPCQPIKI
eukprot:CCRYP_009772-RA/>CCRYP_009772-RA protein AED:0.17 eAED:0.17 QI:0/0/0/1/0/0/3/0/383